MNLLVAAVILVSTENYVIQTTNPVEIDVKFESVTAQIESIGKEGTLKGIAKVSGCDHGEGHIFILNTKNNHIEVDYDWSVHGQRNADDIAIGLCKEYQKFTMKGDV
jgi:hypothetical protein